MKVTGAALLLIGTLLAALPARGQTPRSTHGCFRGAPAERCRWFALTEAGAHYRFSDVIEGDERVLFAYALGFMVNRSERTALGAEAFGGVEGELRGGLAVRWRRWLGTRSSLDLATGIHLLGEASAGTVRVGSPMVQAKLTHADLVGVSARLDVLSLRDACATVVCTSLTDRTSTRVYLGAEVGSGLGVTGMVVTGVVFVVALIAYASN